MNLEKAKKISGTLSIVFFILSIIVLCGAILFAICTALIWLLPIMADYINPYSADIQITGLNLCVGDVAFSIPMISVASLVSAIKIFSLFLAFYYSKKIFKHIKNEESPFHRNIAEYIRLIGIYLLVYQVIWSWENGMIQVLLSIIIPLIMLCISFIFDYGCSLQKEVDETL